jgi:PASTA domain
MTGSFKYTADNTTAIKTADPELAAAFCRGRKAYIDGGSANPFVSGSEKYTAWQAGYDTVTPEGLRDGCANAIPITMPDLTGMSIAVASAAIVAAGLTVGNITGDSGVVTVQAPAAAAKTQPADVVTFTVA